MIPEHIIVGETQAPWAARQEGQRRCLDLNPKDPDTEVADHRARSGMW